MSRTQAKTAAVIVAAGKGLRMGGNIPKQYLMLSGKPVLSHTLAAFEKSSVDTVIIVCPEGDEDYIRKEIIPLASASKVAGIIPGGRERFDSCYRGILEAAKTGAEYVLIHDGVRALITSGLIDSVIDSLKSYRAVCPAVPVKDTVRIADEEGFSVETLDRSRLRIIQTPQGFETKLIMNAYEKYFESTAEGSLRIRAVQRESKALESLGTGTMQRESKATESLGTGTMQRESEAAIVHSGHINSSCQKAGVTDDAMLVETYTNVKVKLIEGSYENIKLTTPEDMLIAEALLHKNCSNVTYN